MGIIQISGELRLRTFGEEEYDKALLWYQDEEIQYLVNGIRTPYRMDTIKAMYTFLRNHGELYFIEILENNKWKAIGDVALVQNTNDDLPIMIGDKSYWWKRIGTHVLKTLIKRAKDLGRKELKVEIYDYNKGSINLYLKQGFIRKEKTNHGYKYYLNLETESNKD